MAEKRIVCVGTGERLTTPVSLNPENGRYYRYPKPGEIHVWGGERTAFELEELPGHKLAATFPGGPEVQGYGLLTLTDTYTQHLKLAPQSEEFGGRNVRQWEVKIAKAEERAAGIEELWWNYGALIIADQLPTDDELRAARERRRVHAMNLLSTAINNHKGGRHPVYSDPERAWAREFGMLLPDTIDSLPKSRVEVVENTPCIYCQNLVHERALKCKHCGEKFGKPLIELLKEAEAIPEAAPEVHRGPGRPRKELVEV